MSIYSDPIFTLANGDLSAYAFACGYVQDRNGWQLFKDGCYHVRRSRDEWATYSSLSEARLAQRRLAKPDSGWFVCVGCEKACAYEDGSGDCRACVRCCRDTYDEETGKITYCLPY
jgi:hypothetical protein